LCRKIFLLTENEPHETFVTNDTRITLNDLEPFTTYALSVKASTEAGEGPSSPFVIVTTEEDGTALFM